MKLVLLGTGGYFPNGRRHTACFMLPEVGVVLDAGSGMCRVGDYLQTNHLDIFLTHAHLDHIVGLTYLVNVIPQETLLRTTLHGQAAKLAAVREHLFAEPIFPVEPQFRFATLHEGPCPLPDGGALSHFRLPHPGGSLGFRLDWPGHSLAYVTDTTASAAADYVPHIRGVDLLLHEAFFATDEGELPALTGHSSVAGAIKAASAANVRRVILVHLDPRQGTNEVLSNEAPYALPEGTFLGVDQAEFDF